MILTPQKWDSHSIVAEIHRRGMSLERIAAEAGCKRASLSWSMKIPKPRFNRVIADFLGVSLHELWPHWFDRDDKLISTQALPRRVDRITRGSHPARAAGRRQAA